MTLHHAKSGRQATCSDECLRALKILNLHAKSPLPADHPAMWYGASEKVDYFDCHDCGAAAAGRQGATRCARCREIHNHGHSQRFVGARCHECGDYFVGDRQQFYNAGSNGRTYCSDRCAKRYSARLRRVREKEAFVEHINTCDVFADDDLICQLCGEPTVPHDWSEGWHPLAATIDHIVPLAKGGKHERANVQTAHALCNSLKSDESYAA